MSPDSKPPKMLLPRLIKRSVLLEGFFKVFCDQLEIPGHSGSHPYYSLSMPSSAVVIIAQTTQGQYVLIEEYRHPTREVLLSCPAGYLAEGEQPEVGAARELLEETGYVAKYLVTIGSAYPYAGISNQKLFFVAAFDAEKHANPILEPMEVLNTQLLSPQELQDRIEGGHPVDGNLCTALFFLGLKGQKRL